MDKIDVIFDRTKQVEDLKEIQFQSLSWNEGDFEKEDSDILQYEIYISGVNAKGHSILVRVVGFTPYFYVLVPDSWTKSNAELFYKHIKGKLWNDGYGLVDYDFVKRKKIYPFLAGRQFKFVRLIFSTNKAFNKCKWLFTKKNQTESGIGPIIGTFIIFIILIVAAFYIWSEHLNTAAEIQQQEKQNSATTTIIIYSTSTQPTDIQNDLQANPKIQSPGF